MGNRPQVQRLREPAYQVELHRDERHPEAGAEHRGLYQLEPVQEQVFIFAGIRSMTHAPKSKVITGQVLNQEIQTAGMTGRRHRSRLVTLLVLAFGVMSLVNFGRAIQSYLNLTLLADWNISFAPWLLLVLSRCLAS